MLRVVFPAAISGIAAAIVLGLSPGRRRDDDRRHGRGQRRPRWSPNPLEGGQTMTGFIATAALGDSSRGSLQYNTLFAVGLPAVRLHARHQHDQHPHRSTASGRPTDGRHHREVQPATPSRWPPGQQRRARTASRWSSWASSGSAWSSASFLVVLLVDHLHRRASAGYDSELFTNYTSRSTPETAGARAAILGSVWSSRVTALHGHPDRDRRRRCTWRSSPRRRTAGTTDSSS